MTPRERIAAQAKAYGWAVEDSGNSSIDRYRCGDVEVHVLFRADDTVETGTRYVEYGGSLAVMNKIGSAGVIPVLSWMARKEAT